MLRAVLTVRQDALRPRSSEEYLGFCQDVARLSRPAITELVAARIRTITRRDFHIRRCSKLRLRHAFSFFGELSTKIPQRNPSFP